MPARSEAPTKRAIRKRAQYAHPALDACVLCGTTERLERHHPDYSKPTEIEVVCCACHPKLDARDGTGQPPKKAKVCVACGVSFTHGHSRVKTCSPGCLSEHVRKKPNICTICGAEFRARNAKTKTCSPSCTRQQRQRTGLKGGSRKLTDADARAIRQARDIALASSPPTDRGTPRKNLRGAGALTQRLAEQYGVTPDHIRQVWNGNAHGGTYDVPMARA